MDKLLVILGSTSTGKTDLALYLAKKLNGELVSCDSRQVYIGLDLGTGKFPGGRWKKGKGFWEIDGVKIWMYDVISPNKQYTVYDYVKDARKAIEEILKRDKLPIIVGGTGLYLKALLEGLSNLTIPVDLKLRKELEKLSLGGLQKRLQEVSAQKWEKMNNSDRQNPRRLVRYIELVSVPHTREILLLYQTVRDQNDILKIGLTASREILYQRSDERVISRINQGMIDEASKLYKKGLSLKRMRQLGLEYAVLADYLSGEIKNKEELIRTLQGKIHHYIRRQLTWFKKEEGINWFDITSKGYIAKMEKRISEWYY